MEKIRIGKGFRFEAGHHLPYYDGCCSRRHGHSFQLIIEVEGYQFTNKENPEYGMVMDYSRLKSIVKENIISKLDHFYLNDQFSNPTAENILSWIVETLRPLIQEDNLELSKVILKETEGSYAEWRKE